jgi:hypothetical protein
MPFLERRYVNRLLRDSQNSLLPDFYICIPPLCRVVFESSDPKLVLLLKQRLSISRKKTPKDGKL